MRLYALLLTIGIVALSHVAEAQATFNPPPSGPSCTTSNGITTLKVQVLDTTTGFGEPERYFPTPLPATKTYQRPAASVTTIQSSSAMANDLSKAFAIAPYFFQKQLCALDGVFIDPTGCTNFNDSNICTTSDGTPITPQQVTEASWGFREGPGIYTLTGNQDHYQRYIATSAGPWSGQGVSAPTYSKYEQAILDLLLPHIGSFTSNSAPQYQPANPGAEISAMSVLAALAHEFGHVLWYDTFRPVPGGDYTGFTTFCNGTFYTGSWKTVEPPPFWRRFGELQDEHKTTDDDVKDLYFAVVRSAVANASQDAVKLPHERLHRISRTQGHWTSLFAALSPDEDFVETFKFVVLKGAVGAESGSGGVPNPHSLASLPLNIGTSTYIDDVPKDFSQVMKTELARKVLCIQGIVDSVVNSP